MNNKINYKYRSLIKYIFLPIASMMIVLDLFFNIKEEYLYLTKLISLILNFLIFTMVLIKINNKRWGALKYIGIGNFFIFLIKFIDLEFLKFNFNFIENIKANILITIIELSIIYLSLLIYRVGFNKYSIINIICNLIVLIKINYITNNKNYFIMSSCIIIMLFLLITLIYLEVKKSKEEYNKLLLSSLIIVICCILNIISIQFNFMIILTYITNLIYIFLIYSIFEEKLLYFTYLNAYEKLNNVKNKKVELNKKLSLREDKLKELNLLFKKGDDRYTNVISTFSDGLLVFEDDILIYSNYYRNIDSFDINKNGMKLSEVLYNLTGEEYLYTNNLDYMNKYFEVISKSKEKSFFECYLFKIDNSKKIVVLNNVTDIIKKRQELIDIENIINKENIKDEFYSNISHELRTPINIIYSAIQLNEIYVKKYDLNKIDKNNEVIMQNCLRLIRTINNFIDSNKLTEGYLEMNKQYYNLVTVIENIVFLSNTYMKKRNTNLIFDTEKEEIYFYCDKNQIERIMLNILSNSLKYGKENGNIYIRISAKDYEKIIIEVINDADAIPEEKRKIIFDKFTKVNTSLNRPSEGSGLGLFLTKKLVEIHGGNISLNAGKKKGNIFKIELPYKNVEEDKVTIVDTLDLKELEERVKIEFSDIYF